MIHLPYCISNSIPSSILHSIFHTAFRLSYLIPYSVLYSILYTVLFFILCSMMCEYDINSIFKSTFHVQPKSGSEVRPICSLLNKFLYESPYTGQFWMLYNTHKKLICCGDAFCHQVANHSNISIIIVVVPQYSSKLDRGDYVVKLQVSDMFCSISTHLCLQYLLNQVRPAQHLVP